MEDSTEETTVVLELPVVVPAVVEVDVDSIQGGETSLWRLVSAVLSK